jgi:hypothetical protein
VSDDFYGNDLFECADDAIEADFAMGNVPVYGNRIADSFMGISSQAQLHRGHCSAQYCRKIR